MTAKTTLASKLVPGCCLVLLLLLLASVTVLAQEDGGYEEEEGRGQRQHEKNDASLDAAANATLRCWYCVGRFRSWADCQRVNEVDFCEPEQPGGQVRCMTSSIVIEKANGDRKFHRLAGCALNETALQDLYMETFEVSFNQTSAVGPNITLQEFNVCTGSLCNVMDQEAFQRGSGRVVKLNMPGAAPLAAGISPVVTFLTALLGVVFAMK